MAAQQAARLNRFYYTVQHVNKVIYVLQPLNPDHTAERLPGLF
jgi:hypothetical protein